MMGFHSRFVRPFSICLFTTLPIVLIAAQYNRVFLANQPDVSANSQMKPTHSVPDSQKPPVGFQKALVYTSGGPNTRALAVGDLNGDGYPDIVMANFCCPGGTISTISVLLGTGKGTFEAPVTYSTGGQGAGSVAIGDVNGDGIPDLAVANQIQGDGSLGGVVSVLLGNGNGTFQSPVSYLSGGGAANSVVIVDVNNDSLADLVVSNRCQSPEQCGTGIGQVAVLLGNGNGTFQAPLTYSSGGYNADSIAVGDVNGDGIPDVVVANDCGNDPSCSGSSDGNVSVLLGNGAGSFLTAVIYDSGGVYPFSVAIGDVNGDGIPDLAVANQCGLANDCSLGGGAGVLLGNGNGTFQAPVSYNAGGEGGYSVAIGDVNGDGRPDLVMATWCQLGCGIGGKGRASVLLGNGNGSFQTAVVYSTAGAGSDSVVIADLNGDGRPDLIVANFCQISFSSCNNGDAGVLLNKTSFTTKAALISSPNPSLINQTVTFTATISSTTPVPNGEVVAFYNGATKIGTGATTNGIAKLTTPFETVGKYTIEASYPGDAFHKASSRTVKQVVNP
jgi:hypothetical protein